MTSRTLLGSVVLGSLLTLAFSQGCGAEPRGSGFGDGLPDASAADGATEGGTGGFDVPDGGAAQLPLTRIRGVVFAPNGSLPMAGVLVYVTATEPAAIPDQTYCDKCVELEEGSFGYSGPDGAIDFQPRGEGERFLVVQKGQFRKVRKITLTKGETSVPAEAFTMPKTTDAAKGDTAPKMLIVKGVDKYDKIEQSLDKLGIEYEIATNKPQVLRNATELAKHHVVFLPCDQEDELEMQDPQVLANLRQYVEGGGKLYVTDYSYEYVRQPFGQRIQWRGETSTLGSAADATGGQDWSGPAKAEDKGLGDWLAANGHASWDTEANFLHISAVNTIPGLDENGAEAQIVPKVWVTARENGTGPDMPCTVSFQNGCGRVLYSTYHTEAGNQFLPQEKALLYILLEVGVCVGKPPGGPR